MTKIVVETTGDFMLQDITNGAPIEAEGSTEVEKTGFVESQIELGRLKEVSGPADHKADRYDINDAGEPAQENAPTKQAPKGSEAANTTKK